jgi:xylulose-5-phosphate/fructose-6-phosphate phosphoketolase
LVQDVINRVPQLKGRGDHLKQAMQDLLIQHRLYINEHGEDMPVVRAWRWAADHS